VAVLAELCQLICLSRDVARELKAVRRKSLKNPTTFAHALRVGGVPRPLRRVGG
jgi:hypothetical protein